MKVMFIFGTRPEAVKMASLILYCKKYKINHVVCNTEQHKTMCVEVLDFFNIVSDYNLDCMTQNQSLSELSARMMPKLEAVMKTEKPDVVVVQGDTTTAFVAGLVAFYNKIKVAHLEAGLRTYEKFYPFPEEINRQMISKLADVHFAPTKKAMENLIKDGVLEENILLTGNSVVDAVNIARNSIDYTLYDQKYININRDKPIVLFTCHRRENFENILEIFTAVQEISKIAEVVFPVHPNPNVLDVARKTLSHLPSIHLLDPLPYAELIYFLSKADLVVSDSGGIQEEVVSFNKHIIITRNETERQEVVDCGLGHLCGHNKDLIVAVAMRILNNQEPSLKDLSKNPFGEGDTADLVLQYLLKTI